MLRKGAKKFFLWILGLRFLITTFSNLIDNIGLIHGNNDKFFNDQ